MRSNVSNSSFQPAHQNLDRIYEQLIGHTLDVETQIIGTLLSKSGNLEKQIEDVQAIMNQLRLKIVQNSLSVIENIVSSKDVNQSYLEFKRMVDENSEKYRQIQIFNQMKSILNQKIVSKIEILNNQAQNNEQLRQQVLNELESLNNNLEKVDNALQKFQSVQDILPYVPGFSVLKDLQQSQQYENLQQYETQRSYNFEENSTIKDKIQINQDNFLKKNENHNQDADDEIEESNIYADEAVSMNEITQSNLYATQDLNLNQITNKNNSTNHNNQNYQSYQKPRVDDLHQSNLKLITPVVQKLNSIGYKTEPDSAMTPLHSADMIKTSIYKTPSDNNNNNKKLFKNNLNAIYQSNFDSHDLNQIISSDAQENEEQNSFNPPTLQIQGSETVSAGDLISPQVINNNDKNIGCTSFNKSMESSSQNLPSQFEAVSETKNENNVLTFGNNNNIFNNIKTDQSSVFNNQANQQQKQNKNYSNKQNQEEETQQNKLIDMFDACLNSLQQPDLISMKRNKNQQEKKIIEEEEKQNDSIDEFVLHEKEINQNMYLNNSNQQKKEDQEAIKFNGVNISNVHEIEEYKGDNSFFSQKDFSITHTEKDNKKQVASSNQEPKFVSTFGLNQSEDPQAAYLEQKFGKEHFEIDQFSYEKELEDKINNLKKQLFSNEALGNLAQLTTGNFSQNLIQKQSNTDTIKPVITRKDELEALGMQDVPEVEQFQVVEEQPEYSLQEEQFSDSDKKVNQQDSKQNSKKLFEESNRYYQTFDEDTLKEIQQQKYQKSEELSINNQIEEQEEVEEGNEEHDIKDQYESTLKQNEDMSIPRSTLVENQFVQPINKEIPNYAGQYENLVNQFLSKPNNFSKETNNQKKQPVNIFDDKNQFETQDKQSKPDLQNTFGIDLKELSLNNSKKSSQGNKLEETLKQTVNEVVQEEQQNEIQNKDSQSQIDLPVNFVRQQEYTKCRIFDANDFLKNANYNSNELKNESLENSLKQLKDENAEQNNLINKLKSKLREQSKANERYNEKVEEKNQNNVDDDQGQEEEDNDFERDETPSFLDDFKNKMAKKIPQKKMHQNFMQEVENANVQIKNITNGNQNVTKILNTQAVEEQVQQQELFQTAHFESSDKFLNQRFDTDQVSKKSFKNKSIQQQSVEEETENKENQEDYEEQEQEESKQQNEEQENILEEPIESLMEDYPMLFQNAQLQQMVNQSKSKQDLAKTTKLTQKPKQIPSNTPQQNLKKNNIIENKSTNSINKLSTSQLQQQSQQQPQQQLNTGLKKIPPKKPSLNTATNNTSQSNITSKQNLVRKSNNSVTQISSARTIQANTEKENYKSLQNSEVKSNSSELVDSNEQANLQRTLKNTKSKVGVITEKPKIRSSSIKNEEEEQQIKKQSRSNLIPSATKQPQIQVQQEQLKEEKEDMQKPSQGVQLNKVKSSQNFSGKKLVNSSLVLNKKSQQ